MKQINLLPNSYKNNLKLERLLKGVIAAQAVALFLSILFAALFNVLSDNLNKKANVYSEYIQSNKYMESEKVIDEVKRLNDKIEALELIKNSIETPDSVTAKDIKHIFSHLPQGVFANTVSFNAVANKVTFDGLSEQKTSITAFADALATSGDFSEIIIKSMTSKNNAEMVSFTLDIYYLEEAAQ